VAVDGPDAAGKTTLADALVGRLDRPVVRASVDSFHRPRAQRLARGPLSPEGYYRDSFDLDALRDRLLIPFAAGAEQVRAAAYDHVDDRAVDEQPIDVPALAVLVVDGVFLLRPELRGAWDVAVHLHVAPEMTLRRALERDVALMGDEATVRTRYEQRYLPGQELYRAEADPWSYADLALDASDPQHPMVLAQRDPG
jgi:uridine kinase